MDVKKTKAQRQAETAGHAKCKECGNVLGLDRVQQGIKRCRGCLSDEDLFRKDTLSEIASRSSLIQDAIARECIRNIIRYLAENMK